MITNEWALGVSAGKRGREGNIDNEKKKSPFNKLGNCDLKGLLQRVY